MKKFFALATLLLLCSLMAAAQMGSTPNQTPPQSTPSTFPQDQTGQSPANPATPSNPSAIPPDTSASGSDRASADTDKTSLTGCLSQSNDGYYMLADNSGANYHLRGDTSELSSYIGKQVRVEGRAIPANTAGAMASAPGTDSASQFSVQKAHKVADNCTASDATTPR
jgi:hypothetical protein